jgi:hypothetical protein
MVAALVSAVERPPAAGVVVMEVPDILQAASGERTRS